MFYRIGLEVKGVDFFQPGILVRRVDRIGLASERQHLVAFKNDMVFEAVKSHTPDFQQGLHFGVARQAVGFVVVVGEYRINRKPGGQVGQGILGRVMAHQEARWQVEILQAKLR